MRIGTTHLFIPGPTTIPESVRQAMAGPMQDMRAPDFGDLTKPLFADLKTIFRTETGRVFLFPGSGTGAWEAAITNTLNPGDKVLMARHGQFSTLWAEMAARLGLDVELMDLDWGEAAPTEWFAEKLAADASRSIRAVFVTQNETATGVTSDVAAVRRSLDAAGHDALLFVDGVSSIASIDFRMDDWGVDLAVSGSQKGFMAPAGLGILAVSEKALDAATRATTRRAYFEFADMIKMNDAGYFPYTPPTTIMLGLRAGVERLLNEGLDNVIARHARLAEGVRQGVAAWANAGCRIAAARPEIASDTVTAILTPEGVDARNVLRFAYERYNTSFGAGLGPLMGKAFRIGHLGDLNEVSCLAALGAAELALADAGAMITPGAGVGAAQAYYRQSAVQPMAIAAE